MNCQYSECKKAAKCKCSCKEEFFFCYKHMIEHHEAKNCTYKTLKKISEENKIIEMQKNNKEIDENNKKLATEVITKLQEIKAMVLEEVNEMIVIITNATRKLLMKIKSEEQHIYNLIMDPDSQSGIHETIRVNLEFIKIDLKEFQLNVEKILNCKQIDIIRDAPAISFNVGKLPANPEFKLIARLGMGLDKSKAMYSLFKEKSGKELEDCNIYFVTPAKNSKGAEDIRAFLQKECDKNLLDPYGLMTDNDDLEFTNRLRFTFTVEINELNVILKLRPIAGFRKEIISKYEFITGLVAGKLFSMDYNAQLEFSTAKSI